MSSPKYYQSEPEKSRKNASGGKCIKKDHSYHHSCPLIRVLRTHLPLQGEGLYAAGFNIPLSISHFPFSIFHFQFSIEKKPAEASIKAVRISEIIFFIFNNPSG